LRSPAVNIVRGNFWSFKEVTAISLRVIPICFAAVVFFDYLIAAEIQ